MGMVARLKNNPGELAAGIADQITAAKSAAANKCGLEPFMNALRENGQPFYP